MTEQEVYEMVDDILSDVADEDKAIEIPVDNDAELPPEKVAAALESKNPREALDDVLSEMASDYACDWLEPDGSDRYDQLIDKVAEEMSQTPEGEEAFQKYEEQIAEYIGMEYFFEFKNENLINPDVCMQIEVDTNEKYEMPQKVWDENVFYNREVYSSLKWLAEQQGHGKAFDEYVNDLAENACYAAQDCSGNKFMKSIDDEWVNAGSSGDMLTFAVKMSFNEAAKLKETLGDKKKRHENVVGFDKEVRCGLFDVINGGGSRMGIELEKNVKIPAMYISAAVPDIGKKTEYGRYGLMDVYGKDDSFYERSEVTVKKAREPKKEKNRGGSGR